jgi:hypothetical protein
MGENKGTKAAQMREMGERGEFAKKLPARVGRKPPVVCREDLALEMIERFGRGETLTVIERDPLFPSRQAFHMFVMRNEALAARWQYAKVLHAERLMDETGPIADRQVKGPDGRHDSGAVQRDKLRIEQRHLRAAALDPSRWGRKSETTLVGDMARPVAIQTPLTPVEVREEVERILRECEAELGLTYVDSLSHEERMRNLQVTGRPVTPELYALLPPPRERN